ncbi:hypothetical protein [Allohahella marinimesophila]|uniref:Uncharacterized protein n=1 Tax=Allohahella marinimesophila TaxID=1054972 RepID=A0ABP7Q008_9GAMM
MNFPLQFTFKILAFAPQLSVTDARGKELAYVQQKLFKLKEAVTVYANSDKQQIDYEIKADRIIDISTRFNFRSADGTKVGSVKRRGMRSLWRATYEVYDAADAISFTISEANPWTKMIDSVLGNVPVLGFLTGYFLHPSYNVIQNDRTVARMTKQPAFFEGRFMVERHETLSEQEEQSILLGLMMLVLMERERG